MKRRLTTCMLLTVTSTATAGNVSSNWNTGGPGSTGFWMASSNWDPAVIPGHTGGFINYYANIGIGGVTVDLDTNTTINALDMGFATTLRVYNGVYLDLREGLANDGLIQINGTTSVSNLIVSSVGSDFYLAGSGEIRFASHPNSRLVDFGVPRLINGSNHTLSGAGSLIRNGMAFTNEGFVVASTAGDILSVDPGNPGAVNEGTMSAIDGGTLVLRGGDYDNTAGLVEALAGSTVSLSTGLDIDGGVYRTEDDGEIRVIADITLRNPTIDGTMVIEDIRSPIFTGIFTNDGTIRLDGQTALTRARLGSGGVTIEGSGTLDLGDSDFNVVTATTSSGSMFVHEVTHTIQGGGNLGGDNLLIVNLGTIRGNAPTPLTIEPGSDDALLNSGLILAEGAGGVVLRGSGHTNQLPGEIRVASTLTIEPGTTLVNNGQLVLDTPAATIINDGELFLISDGSLAVTVQDAANFSAISGGGVVQLAGRLYVGNLHYSGPEDVYCIIEGSTVSGSFDTVSGPRGPQLAYFADHVELTFTCPSEIDGDGQVAVGDLLAVLAAWGTPDADVDGDGTTDVNDLLQVLGDWGNCG